MSEPVYFQGQPLPPLRPGNTWSLCIYPGGRKKVTQVRSERIQTIDAAVKALCRGDWAHVQLGDAVETLIRWKQTGEQRRKKWSLIQFA